MNFLLISIIAYLLNALATLGSKFILTKNSEHPISYVFYISAAGLVTVVLLPLTHLPSFEVLALASLSTLLWTTGAFFLFSALTSGLASRVSPIVGTLNPLFLIIYYFFFAHTITLNEVWGAFLCTIGLFVIIFPYLHSRLRSIERHNRIKEISCEILAGLFFAASYVVLKEVYNRTDFFTGLVYSRFILIPILLLIVAFPYLRRHVFSSKGDKIEFRSKTGMLFVGSQIAGGLSQFLITLAVSLANPAIVNSMQGVQYIFLFLAGIFLTKKFPSIFKESSSTVAILQTVTGIVVIGTGLFVLAFANTGSTNPKLGVTYSPRYAKELGLDPKSTYLAILDQLHPKTIRLPIYWDLVEPGENQFDFSDTDYYIKEAEQKGVELTLVVGFKVPRYPECYSPSWAKSVTTEDGKKELYLEIATVVNRYKNSPALTVWQVENEPLFPFGTCPPADLSRLEDEVALVRQLDPTHPIMVTESGEFGLWLTTAHLSDIVGTTLYRRTLAPYLPQFKSPIPPFYYQLKGMIVRLFYPNRKVYVSELQGEPWANQPIETTTFDYDKEAFPPGDLKDNVEFSKQAGFDSIYLWGVEWWYWLQIRGHSEYWDQAKLIYNDSH